MNFTPIELSHKDKINSYLKAQKIESSELTFTTMYIWRNAFNFSFAEVDGCLIIRAQDNGYPPSLRCPLGSGDKKSAVEKVCRYLLSIGETPRFYGITENMADGLEELFANKFTILEMEDYSDYVYKSEKLINLSGKKMHSKKNHLNSFKNTYKYEYSRITSADAQDIINEYDKWFSSDDMYLVSERDSIADILNNYDKLGLVGGKLTADGVLCAFTIGEQLSEDTAVVHIEKANTDIKGAFAAINQMYVEHEWSHIENINREEDCGIEGLRKAKQSYHPDFMIKKYKAILKDNVI